MIFADTERTRLAKVVTLQTMQDVATVVGMPTHVVSNFYHSRSHLLWECSWSISYRVTHVSLWSHRSDQPSLSLPVRAPMQHEARPPRVSDVDP